jgi:hypothetical protein
MVDRDDLDKSRVFINPVDHPEGAPSGAPKTFELECSRLPTRCGAWAIWSIVSNTADAADSFSRLRSRLADRTISIRDGSEVTPGDA